MFHGTMIDELMNIVERAEEHARVPEVVETKVAGVEMMPGFLFEASKLQSFLGVA
jgi:hypothetical protein